MKTCVCVYLYIKRRLLGHRVNSNTSNCLTIILTIFPGIFTIFLQYFKTVIYLFHLGDLDVDDRVLLNGPYRREWSKFLRLRDRDQQWALIMNLRGPNDAEDLTSRAAASFSRGRRLRYVGYLLLEQVTEHVHGKAANALLVICLLQLTWNLNAFYHYAI